MLHRYLPTMAAALVAAFVLSCGTTQNNPAQVSYAPGTGPTDRLQLPAPFATPSARNNSKVIGWPQGKMPTPAPGLRMLRASPAM